MPMVTLEFEHTFVSEQILDSITRQIESMNVHWRLPLNRSEPLRSKRTQIAYTLLLDPVVEFDESKTVKSDVEALFRRHGFKLRLVRVPHVDSCGRVPQPPAVCAR